MTSFRAVFLAALVSIFLASCGETFRPIAIPVIGAVPGAEASKTANVISNDASAGYATQVNLSGGTITGIAPLGQGAVHAVSNGVRIFTANSTASTMTAYAAASPQSSLPSTITLTAGANPVFVALSGNLFVAYQALDQVGVVNQGSAAEIGKIPLPAGSAPVALVATPDGTKIFTANFGLGSVSVIDTASLSVTKTISFASPACTNPSWLTVSPDSKWVHVVCTGSNVVHVINVTTLTQETASGIAVGSSPNFAVYDALKSRLVVTNPGSNTVTFIDELPNSPTVHMPTNVPVGISPQSVTVLASGTKAYVANYGAGTTNGSVTVIDNGTLNVINVITIPTINVSGTDYRPRPNHIASSRDGLRVGVTAESENLSAIKAKLYSIPIASDTISAAFDIPGQPKFLLIQ